MRACACVRTTLLSASLVAAFAAVAQLIRGGNKSYIEEGKYKTQKKKKYRKRERRLLVVEHLSFCPTDSLLAQ